ncbi:hypothetical protein [Enterovirga sp. CN4-39]|uniref:hypothetical protein n=1 Tax=Enterovirga sp. CN4-39 TaxID=3400910 RepID=UPI003C088BA9
MTRGATLAGRIVKIHSATGGRLAAAAGRASYNGAFLRWADIMDGDPPEAKSDDDCHDTGIIFERDGRIMLFEPDGWFEASAPYFAIGSGRDQALGAMFMGAGAEDAIRAAIAHDVWTNGDVVTLRHGDA